MFEIQHLITTLNRWVWGFPLLILLLLVGGYLTVCTRGLQFRRLWYAHKCAFRSQDKSSKGDISHFQALMTALAATIGIGSITGVAMAISVGGLGSLFWMWLVALLGMATKYSEAILAVKYRVIDKSGGMCGGPMYYLERGLKKKWLGKLFAFFALMASLGIGNMVQSHSVSDAMRLFNIPNVWTGIILSLCVGIATISGIKSIGRICSILVPAMALFYIAAGLLVIFLNIKAIPSAFVLIFKTAFSGQAAIGGFVGSTVMMAIQSGVSESLFSSEAGMGSSSIAAAAAKTDTPGRQALVSMCSVFLTTVVVCTITGLVIALSGLFGALGSDGKQLNGSALALRAFDQMIPYGGIILTVAIFPFGYSTILGWAYYGEKSIAYLFGARFIKIYRIFFMLLILPGAILSLEFVWGFSNLMNGLMAFPNLFGLFLLAGVVAKETKLFEKRLKQEESPIK